MLIFDIDDTIVCLGDTYEEDDISYWFYPLTYQLDL
jgi:hypothetical protein